MDIPTDHSLGMEPTAMSFDNSNPQKPILKKNGKVISQKQVDALAEKHRKAIIMKEAKRNQLVTQKSEEFRYRYSLAKATDSSDSTGFFKMRLTKRQIEQMIDESDDLINIVTTKTPPPTPTLASAIQSIQIAPYAHSWGHLGNGVGVWIDEMQGLPDSNNPFYNLNQITYQTPWLPADEHATQVTLSHFAAAPNSHVYASISGREGIWGGGYRDCGTRVDILYQNSPPVYIANLSWELLESYGAPYPYQYCDRVWDNFVYEKNITVFASAGNIKPTRPQTVVGTPGKALNIITVGAYNDVTKTMADFSAYANSNMYNDKPEIVAPGVSLDIGQWTNISGTSIASPLAAGFATDLTGSNISYYGRHPEVIKALLMAGANRNIEGSSQLSEKDGAGGIRYTDTALFGYSQWWRGGHNDFFDAGRKITIKSDGCK